jgi:GNAT superfamily N-acetyltransferase
MAEATRVHDRWAPGLVGDIPAPHARHYAASQAFEREVAAESGALMARFDPRRDFLRTAEGGGGFLGSVAVDGGAEAAQFRFFIPAPALRGQELGRRWLGEAVAHARGAGFRRVFLWTLGGLDAATALHEEAGFVLEDEGTAAQYGHAGAGAALRVGAVRSVTPRCSATPPAPAPTGTAG